MIVAWLPAHPSCMAFWYRSPATWFRQAHYCYASRIAGSARLGDVVVMAPARAARRRGPSMNGRVSLRPFGGWAAVGGPTIDVEVRKARTTNIRTRLARNIPHSPWALACLRKFGIAAAWNA